MVVPFSLSAPDLVPGNLGPRSWRLWKLIILENMCRLLMWQAAVVYFCMYYMVFGDFPLVKLVSVRGVRTPGIFIGPRGSVGPLTTWLPSNDAVDVDVEAIGPMGDVADGARCIVGGKSI